MFKQRTKKGLVVSLLFVMSTVMSGTAMAAAAKNTNEDTVQIFNAVSLDTQAP